MRLGLLLRSPRARMYRSSAENSETVARATPLLTVVMEWWRARMAGALAGGARPIGRLAALAFKIQY